MKIGRNDPCPCGSGLKYKKCCLNTAMNKGRADVDTEITDAALLSLQHDKSSKEAGVRALTEILARPNLTENQIMNGRMLLANAFQQLGQSRNALDIYTDLYNTYNNKDKFTTEVLLRASISYTSLGYSDESSKINDEILEKWEKAPPKTRMNRKVRGIHLIEMGKSYSCNEEKAKAKECWESALAYLEEFEEEQEHYYRVKSNLAYLLLTKGDGDEQKAAVDELEQLTQTKLLIGDLQGVANNYCNLGLYFRGIGRYERSIAYHRKDLSISREVGNKRDIASTLGNLAILYADLKQYTKGRHLLREAKKIGDELHDEQLQYITKKQLDGLNELAKESGLNKVAVDNKAICACGSDILYKECCGLADFEPVDMPHIYGGISEDKKKIDKEIRECGKNISPLDFLLRVTPQSKERWAWSQYHSRDGWMSVKELPDMANIHLIAAKEMALASKEEPAGTSKPLSAIILSVCHLEAFINQLAFFIYDNNKHPEVSCYTLPEELVIKGLLLFQKTTQLETKWSLISNCLLGQNWLDKQTTWKEIKDLIYVRNELVHFKTDSYEQVVPPPLGKEGIYNKIPEAVVLRQAAHSWPIKLLTPSLATWAVDIAEAMTDCLKHAYSASRRVKK